MKREEIKKAIALSYEPQDNAPKIIATGKGAIAERMVDKAKEHQIPIHQDSSLANTLSRLDIGADIPPELYQVVAEILLFVDKADGLKKKLNLQTKE